MILDCHTHIYPDKLAGVMEGVFSHMGPVYGRLTVSGLISSMDQAGIDTSVVFNVAGKPEAVAAANDFIITVSQNKRLIGFGTIHPDMPAYGSEIARLKANNIKGVKLHSLIQKFSVDEPRMLPIYEALERVGMVVYFHCGKDPANPSAPALTNPQGLSRVLGLFPRLKVVAAHFGGLFMLEEARKHLVGKEVYFDTSWLPSVEVLDPLAMADIIREHGSHRILFGTDYPVTPGRKQVDWLRRLPLAETDKERILGGNARELMALAE